MVQLAAITLTLTIPVRSRCGIKLMHAVPIVTLLTAGGEAGHFQVLQDYWRGYNWKSIALRVYRALPSAATLPSYFKFRSAVPPQVVALALSRAARVASSRSSFGKPITSFDNPRLVP